MLILIHTLPDTQAIEGTPHGNDPNHPSGAHFILRTGDAIDRALMSASHILHHRVSGAIAELVDQLWDISHQFGQEVIESRQSQRAY